MSRLLIIGARAAGAAPEYPLDMKLYIRWLLVENGRVTIGVAVAGAPAVRILKVSDAPTGVVRYPVADL